MKAIIMAGGEGSRLRPMTCDCPKPMTPLMDKPVMSYALELLRRHGVREAAVTLQYLPDRVRDYFGDGSESGLSIRYYVESAPLGTAGSVKQAQDFLTETFVVLSGDGVTDCNLTDALRLHKERGALATLVLKHVENPLEYGVVVADSEGRVKKFVEKPGWGEVFSDTVNTGIYILEPEVLQRIPEGRPYDFGRELFPALTDEGLPVYAYVMNGYWCDIGDISAYLRAHMDAMDGRIDLPMPVKPGGVCRAAGARIDRSAILEGPCYIGPGAVVGAGARIGPYSVLGSGSVVEAGASVKRSVLWRGARMEEHAQARGCVLAEQSVMGRGSSAFEESVLGGGAKLGERSTLLPGIKVWPRKLIADGTRLDANLVWGGGERPGFTNGRLTLHAPAQAARAAQAYASAMKPGSVLIGRAASSVALSHAMAAQAGLMAQGVQVLDAGVSTLPQLRLAVRMLHTSGALFIDGESMRPLDAEGAELRRSDQRKTENLLLRQDFERAFTSVAKLPISAGRSDLIYAGYLTESADKEALERAGTKIAAFAPNEQLLSMAECVLEKCGCQARAEWEEELMELSPGEIGIWLTEGGEGLTMAGDDGSLSESEVMLLRVWTMLELGVGRIILPASATHAADTLAAKYGAQIERVRGERAHWMHALAGESQMQLMMQFDGLYAAVMCIGMLARRNLTLSEWARSMPHLNRLVRTVAVDWKDKGRVLGALLAEETSADLTDGVCIQKGGAWAWVSPSEDLPECRIITEAQSIEAAQELCDFYATRLSGRPAVPADRS